MLTQTSLKKLSLSLIIFLSNHIHAATMANAPLAPQKSMPIKIIDRISELKKLSQSCTGALVVIDIDDVLVTAKAPRYAYPIKARQEYLTARMIEKLKIEKRFSQPKIKELAARIDQYQRKWTEVVINTLTAEGMTQERQASCVVQYIEDIYEDSIQELVEPETAALLNDIQQTNQVLLLTARRADYLEATIGVLESLKIVISNPISGLTEPLNLLNSQDPDKSIRYAEGVCCVGKNSKGRSLRTLFKELKYKPKSAVFLDDQLHNVESVARALTTEGIPHSCHLYYRMTTQFDQQNEEAIVKRFKRTRAALDKRRALKILQESEKKNKEKKEDKSTSEA